MGGSRVKLSKHHKTRFASKSSRNVQKVSSKVGEELGFYRGYIIVWKSAIRIDPACFSVRMQKAIKHMDELLHKSQAGVEVGGLLDFAAGFFAFTSPLCCEVPYPEPMKKEPLVIENTPDLLAGGQLDIL